MRSEPSKKGEEHRRMWQPVEDGSHWPRLKFSEYITSPVVQVTVGEGPEAKVFHVHQKLLEAESERMAAGLKACWLEGQQRKYDLHEEDPGLFGQFVEFIYREDWIIEERPQSIDLSQLLVKTARLYTMAERLLASNLKDEVLYKFKRNELLLNGVEKVNDNTICDLLEIAANELPDMQNSEDMLKSYIIAIAVGSLERLQKSERFKRLLWEHAQLGRAIALKAGSRETWWHDRSNKTIELHRQVISYGVWGEVIPAPETWSPNDDGSQVDNAT